MNRKSRAILIGMILGDGCIKVKKHLKQDGKWSFYYEFVIGHSPKQLDYLLYKKKKLESILGGKKLNVNFREFNLKANNKFYGEYRISRCHKYFRLLHRWVYSNNKKKYYSKKILNWLTPEAIALWFFDDGGLSKYYNIRGEISSFEVRLYPYCSEEEIENIIAFFRKKYSIQFKKGFHKKTGLYTVRANTEEGKKFLKLIHPYKIPSMEYKFV